MDESKKRKRTEDGENIRDGDVHANDAINLVFWEDSIDKAYTVKPTFTHQVFDNEVISGLAKPDETSIEVNICCGDLTTYVGFSKSVCAEEQQILSRNLEAAVPSDYIKMSSESFAEYAPYKLRRSSSDNLVSRLRGIVRPPGICVHTFTTHGTNFEIWRATFADKGAHELLTRAEKIAVWFIETADGIDFSDDRWEALFLYSVSEKPCRGGYTDYSDGENSRGSEWVSSSSGSKVEGPVSVQYYFVGYFTLFTFRNFIAGCKLRICQALIFPNYQGLGLGREMVLQVYRLARERAEVKEVAVEYPAPAFEALKDVTDCDWACIVHDEMVACSQGPISVAVASSSADSKDVLPLFHGDAGSCAHHLKLTSQQAYFVLDALRYCSLPNTKNSKSGIVEESPRLAEFRTDVKRRLQRENPEVKDLPKPKKFQRLEDLYQIQLQRFVTVRKHRAKHKL